MVLEVGKAYRDGRGKRQTIGGPTRDHPEWVFSISGDWFDRATGKMVMFDPKRGHHLHPLVTIYDLVQNDS